MFDAIKPVFDKIKVNDSCGLHMHISFDDMKNYYLLLDWKFVSKFMEDWKRKFNLSYESIRINQHYCKFFKDEKDFLNSTGIQSTTRDNRPSERYRCINFTPFKRTKTVEFRLFPAARTFGKFQEYVTWLTDYIAKYCNRKKISDTCKVSGKFRMSKGLEVIDLNTMNTDKKIITPFVDSDEEEYEDEYHDEYEPESD